MPKLLHRNKSLRELCKEAKKLIGSRLNDSRDIDQAKEELACSYGFFSWKQLQRYIEPDDFESQEFEFLSCLSYCPTDSPSLREKARTILDRDPDLASMDIYHASIVGNVECVSRFLENEPELVNRRGGFLDWEPLLYACYSRLNLEGRSTFDVARVLLQRGANPNAYFMWGGQYKFTALTGAFGEGEMGPVNQPEHERCKDLARLLLDAGADPNDGQALYNRMFEPGQWWIELLLEFGLNDNDKVNWYSEDGVNLFPSDENICDYQLRWAVEKNFVDRARLLIGAGADVTAKRTDGDSYYTVAFKAGNKEFAEQLAALGAEKQELPLVEEFIATCMGGRLDEARSMLRRAPDLVEKAESEFAFTVRNAAGDGHMSAIETFHILGFSLEKMHGQSPLHSAVLGGHVDVLNWLLMNGCDQSVRDDVHGSTPLLWAMSLGRRECEEVLREGKLDLFDSIMCELIENVEGWIEHDPKSIERTLKEARNSKSRFDDDWQTPIAFAALRNKPKSVRCLLRAGANPKVRNPEGLTLLELVDNRGNEAVSKELRQVST